VTAVAQEGAARPAPFSRGSGAIAVAGAAYFEALEYWFLERWSIVGEGLFARVNQDDFPDAYFSGAGFVVRHHVQARPRGSWFVEAGAGASTATTPVPSRGSSFNFILQAGAGATRRLTDQFYLLGGLRWLHLSNKGRFGRDRNPDIQALGGYVGVMLPW
jgi:hypothetical protein